MGENKVEKDILEYILVVVFFYFLSLLFFELPEKITTCVLAADNDTGQLFQRV